MSTELAVPPCTQSTSFSCGAAALASVLIYLDQCTSERELMRYAGTCEEHGTSPEGIVCAAARYGVRGDIREGMSLECLRELVAEGYLVMPLVQAWRDGGPPRGGYGAEWQEGHYVVVTAVGPRRIVMQDPSVHGARATLSCVEFARRWHDRDSNRDMTRAAVVFPPRAETIRKRIGRTMRMG